MNISDMTDLDVVKDLPGYQAILKTILKAQIKQLVELLSVHAGEEAILMTASLSDGTLSHIGSKSGEIFLRINEQVKSQFLGFCLRRHHNQIIEPGKKGKIISTPVKKKNSRSEKTSTVTSVDLDSDFSKESGEKSGEGRRGSLTTTSKSHNAPELQQDVTGAGSQSGCNEESGRRMSGRRNESGKKGKLGDADCSGDVNTMDGIEGGVFGCLGERVMVIKAEPPDSDVSVDVSIDDSDTDFFSSTPSGTAETPDKEVNQDMDGNSQLDEGNPQHNVKWSAPVLMSNLTKKRYGIKRKLNCASIERKYQAILALEAGKKTKTQIAKDFGIPQNTLSSWIKHAENIKNSYLKADYNPRRKRTRRSNHPDIDVALLKWVKEAKLQNVRMSSLVIMEKANEVARKLGYSEEQFVCKISWAERFKSRFGLTMKQSKVNPDADWEMEEELND